ncbi:MAG TPA: hypothetical protein VMT20_23740 [Terriglobia bacterium]|nr:hypothetical protein [Terriglobia bacterium]
MSQFKMRAARAAGRTETGTAVSSALAGGRAKAPRSFCAETVFRRGRQFPIFARGKFGELRASEEPKKSRNEGGSHDIIDNKGQIFETHDVYENKVDNSIIPRYL